MCFAMHLSYLASSLAHARSAAPPASSSLECKRASLALEKHVKNNFDCDTHLGTARGKTGGTLAVAAMMLRMLFIVAQCSASGNLKWAKGAWCWSVVDGENGVRPPCEE